MMVNSEIGMSMTRSAPNFCARPRYWPNAPAAAASSPAPRRWHRPPSPARAQHHHRGLCIVCVSLPHPATGRSGVLDPVWRRSCPARARPLRPARLALPPRRPASGFDPVPPLPIPRRILRTSMGSFSSAQFLAVADSRARHRHVALEAIRDGASSPCRISQHSRGAGTPQQTRHRRPPPYHPRRWIARAATPSPSASSRPWRWLRTSGWFLADEQHREILELRPGEVLEERAAVARRRRRTGDQVLLSCTLSTVPRAPTAIGMPAATTPFAPRLPTEKSAMCMEPSCRR